MGLMKPVGTLDPACPAAQWWLTIVGTLNVPLKSPVPQLAVGANGPEPQQVYMVDISRLTDQEIEGICKVMSAKHSVPLDEVRAGIREEHGLPILAEHVTLIAFDARLVL